jgi:hypothetical protein
MPIKVFSAPGDHRDDCRLIENQVNEWMEAAQPTVVDMHCCVSARSERRGVRSFVLTIVVHYE